MNYQQLILPNLSVVGIAGLCERYTEDVFQAPHGHEADAFQGWTDAQFKHPGETPPANVSVPIFFNWIGTVAGVTKNWGHACVWHEGTVYTSPGSGTGHATFTSIPAIQKAFVLGSYLGWSEDISTLRIVEEDMGLTSDQVNKICVMATDLEAKTNQNFLNNAGQDLDTVLDNFLAYSESKQLRLDAEAYRKGQTANVKPYDGPQLFVKK